MVDRYDWFDIRKLEKRSCLSVTLMVDHVLHLADSGEMGVFGVCGGY